MINYTSSMLIEDQVAQKICGSLDEVLAPIISVLDCYDSYLDVYLAPMDFVRYMSTWILVNPEVGWNDHTVRRSLAHAIQFYEFRGTSRGIQDFLTTVLDLEVTIEESGSVTTSRDSTEPATWPVPPNPSVTITVSGRGGTPVDMGLVTLVTNTALPAHVDATVTEAA
jgi:phage tail-like protein